ncbi:MAG: ParA family protein [Lachnospiraceae bacterium]|nr:ParA family protein [Lachnospiraceae bacterium]
MKTISIANQKGGVGKTTTALNISDALIHSGYDVLFIDLDPQCNSTTSYGAKIKGKNTIYDLMNGNCKSKEAIQDTEFGKIIAGDPLIIEDENKFLTKIGGYNIVRKAIKELENDFDYCIIDTPPNLGIFMYNALVASDSVIIPIKAEKYAIDGLSKLLETIGDIRENANEELVIEGVLLTCYDQRNSLDKQVWYDLPDIAEEMEFNIFKNPIRICQAIKDCQAASVSLFDIAGDSNAAEDYIRVVKQILKK